MPLLKCFPHQDQSVWSDFLQVSLSQAYRRLVLPKLSLLETLVPGTGARMFEEYCCNLNYSLIFPQSLLEKIHKY